MVWVIVIAVIFLVLFVMILVPKATKGYTDNENLKNVAWGKGFKRIYFVASALWMGGFARIVYLDPDGGMLAIFMVFTAPITVYIFFKWIFGGFKKEEKKKINGTCTLADLSNC